MNGNMSNVNRPRLSKINVEYLYIDIMIEERNNMELAYWSVRSSSRRGRDVVLIFYPVACL